MSAEDRLKELGLTLPDVPTPVATYVSFKQVGDLVYLSGQGPKRADGTYPTGKVGKDVTIEEAYQHARQTGLGLLAAMKKAVGSLDKVEVVKLELPRTRLSLMASDHLPLVAELRVQFPKESDA